MVYLTFKSAFGDGVFVQHVIPTETMVQKVVHNIYIDWRCPTIIGKFFMLGEALQVSKKDVRIFTGIMNYSFAYNFEIEMQKTCSNSYVFIFI